MSASTTPPGGSRRSLWTLRVILVVFAAAASGIGVYFVTKSDSDKTASSTPPTTTTTMSTTMSTTMNTTTSTTMSTMSPTPQSQAGLAGVIPPPLFKNSCQIQQKPVIAGAVQSALCMPSPNATVFYPDRWELSSFPNVATLHSAYAALRTQNGIGQNFGRCDGAGWHGEGPWSHTLGMIGAGGRRFCTFEGNVAVIVWTNEALGHPDRPNTLVIARASDDTALFSWWRFWHHRFGM